MKTWQQIVDELLETDALTPNDDGTPTHYTVHADDLVYLVKTVYSLGSSDREGNRPVF